MVLTRGRRPRGRVHADTQEGRHVAQEGSHKEGPRVLWSPGKIVGAVTRKRYTAPIFILTNCALFFRVGLCSHTVLPFAGDVDARRALDSVKTAEIVWTRVHAISKLFTCAKEGISGDDQRVYLTPRGDPGIAYLHQRERRTISIRRTR